MNKKEILLVKKLPFDLILKLKDKASEYLNKLNAIDLKKIAKQANVFIKSRNKKSELINRIVEGTIGVKIKIDILQY